MQYVRVVVSAARLTAVHDDADEAVLGALRVEALLGLVGVVADHLALHLRQALHRVRRDVELARELEVIVELDGALPTTGDS